MKIDKNRKLPNNFTDSLIQSIKTTLLAAASFIVVYLYVAYSLLNHNSTLNDLADLDRILAVQVAISEPAASRPAQEDDIPKFERRAMSKASGWTRRLFSEAIEYLKAIEGEKDEAVREKKLTDFIERQQKERPYGSSSPIEGGRVLEIPMRMTVSGQCDVLSVDLRVGEEVLIVTGFIRGVNESVKSENIKYLKFGLCSVRGDDYPVLFINVKGDKFFAIPRAVAHKFYGGNPATLDISTVKTGFLKRRLPEQLAEVIDVETDYIVLHSRATEAIVLNYASAKTGLYFSVSEMSLAIQKLFDSRVERASYLGITTSAEDLVRLGPLILFGIVFALWRKVRRLPEGRISSNIYWFAFETRSWIGALAAYLQALFPVAAVVATYLAFAISQELEQHAFGYRISFKGIVAWKFPPGGNDFFGSDYYAFALYGVFALHVVVAVLASRKLVRVVSANMSMV